jgi:hypothetical protein
MSLPELRVVTPILPQIPAAKANPVCPLEICFINQID